MPQPLVKPMSSCCFIASAVQSITATFQQKLASGLQGRRDFIIPLAIEQPQEDEAAFDLVTWLVLHDGASPTV